MTAGQTPKNTQAPDRLPLDSVWQTRYPNYHRDDENCGLERKEENEKLVYSFCGFGVCLSGGRFLSYDVGL